MKNLTVPVVLQDLPPAEALHQMFDSLQQLDNVINSVFSTISDRIKSEKSKIASVCSRVEKAQAKINEISRTGNRATTVYSTTKYPAADRAENFQRVYTDSMGDNVRVRTQCKLTKSEMMTKMEPVNVTDLFVAMTNNHADAEEHLIAADSKEGLGRLPEYLPSVSSILLFNSDENPYKKYVTLDNLEGVGGTDRDRAQADLAAAPTTILEGVDLPFLGGADEYVYKPELSAVPTLDLPENLPLSMLADDVKFSGFGDLTIAPSAGLVAETMRLEMSTSTRKAPQQQQNSQVPEPPLDVPLPPEPVAAPQTTAAPPPPPDLNISGPPPPPDLNVDIKTQPPLPDIGAPAPEASSGGGDDDRGDLLAAIRRGKKLKSAKSRKPASPKAKDSSAGGGGMDMMSALRQRLAMRRAATSGKADLAPKKKAPRPVSDDEDDWSGDD